MNARKMLLPLAALSLVTAILRGGELANFDQFLDSHRETAEQLRKDPSLVNNEQFVKSHPDLQAYLQQHPEVREEVKENPNAFMHQEARYERTENAPATPNNRSGLDRDTTRGELANFDKFLDSHRETAEQLRKDPSLVNNEQFVKSHPDLQAYLQQHPKCAKKLRRTLTPSCTRKLAMNARKTPLVTIAAKMAWIVT